MTGTDHFAKLEALFYAASDLIGDERERFVAECSPELRAELEALLRSDSRGGAFVDDPGNAHGGMRRSMPDPMLGERVGAYRLVERIAEGGMGVVYRATREDGAFSQQVAVKLMRGGLVTERQLRRFQHERRLLARLAHPNIARLYDGGTTERGAPYLAMEFIHGMPIDVYCEHERLSIPRRVTLFISVCDAVHSAHQNLVIHRDIKPSNVLVDIFAEPKLLDFGVAKLVTSDDAGEHATETIARVFTPEYASPEQFAGVTLSTATDVYSLGVMLHVLLTGVKPFAAAGLSDPAFARVVGDREPAKPSAIVRAPSTRPGDPNPADVDRFVAHLGTTREKLARQLSGDLGRIVLMALRKEPERRYASVEQFASDLRRWSLGLPVIARPDTLAYRTSKFVRRNWLAVSLSTLVVASLVGGLWASVVQRRQTERERNEAVAQRDHARIEVESGARGAEYLLSIFFDGRRLSVADRQSLLENVLEQAAEARREFGERKHVRANVLHTLGSVCARLGFDADAERLLNEAYAIRLDMFGPQSLEITLSLHALGQLAYSRGQYEQARTLFERALGLQRALPSDVHTKRDELANDLAVTLMQLGRLDEALPLHREALRLRRTNIGAQSLEVAESSNNLGGLLWRLADLGGAQQAFEDAVAIRASILGPNADATLQSEGNLAALFAHLRKWDDAIPRLEHVVAGYRALGASGEEGLPRVLSNLGDVLAYAERYDDAEPIAREAVERSVVQFGASHRITAHARSNLADILRHLGKYEAARAEYEASLAATRGADGQSRSHALTLSGYGMCLIAEQKFEAAIAPLREALLVLDPPGAAPTGEGDTAHFVLAKALAALGQTSNALSEIELALRSLPAQYGEDHAMVKEARALRAQLVEAP